MTQPLISAKWHGNYLRRCAHCTAIFFTDSMLYQVVNICTVWRYRSDAPNVWRHEHLCRAHALQLLKMAVEVVYMDGEEAPAAITHWKAPLPPTLP